MEVVEISDDHVSNVQTSKQFSVSDLDVEILPIIYDIIRR